MEGSERQIERLRALREGQQTVVEAASDIWGTINEDAGRELLEAFVAETRIQSFVLAARGSILDSQGVDAALLLWNQSYMPVNFKSSEWGMKKHEARYRRIPCLMVNRADGPDFLNARAQLMRLVETWYGNYFFKNRMLIPCFPLSPTSPDCKRLLQEVEKHIFALQSSGELLDAAEGGGKRITSILSPVRWNHNGCLTAAILLSDEAELRIEWYLGARTLAWLGKQNKVLIVLPIKGTETSDVKTLLAEAIAKRKKFS